MTSPEWEAANEDDSDRFPQTPHASAPESTESHERGSRVVPDPARVARYAEAIFHSQDGWPIKWADLHEDVQAGYLAEAKVAIALADEERAALVAEVERLRANWARGVDEDGNLPPYCVPFKAHFTVSDELTARAEAAEAEVAKVEVQARSVIRFLDEIAQRTYVPGKPRGWDSQNAWANARCLERVLADAPAEQRTEGGA